jgi:hypothetical protein
VQTDGSVRGPALGPQQSGAGGRVHRKVHRVRLPAGLEQRVGRGESLGLGWGTDE